MENTKPTAAPVAEKEETAKKPTFLYVANNDTFVFECPKGIKKVSGTFNGERAEALAVGGIACVKVSKPLPEYYTYEVD